MAAVTCGPREVESWCAMSLKILFVEDHKDTASVFAHILRKWGHEVDVAACAADARQLAARNRFDLLLCDLGLPDDTGNQLLRDVLRMYPIRAIAISGYSDEQNLKHARAAGFADYLVKPITPDQLHALIQNPQFDASGRS
jgi:CheY-like chemotaxis protein